MEKQRDYYEVLELKRGAGEKEIKSAYRKLVKKYHPDANPDDAGAEEKIKEINDAYAVLSDPQKKADYDQYGHAGPPQSRTTKDDGPFSGGFGGSADVRFEDMFTGGFGNYYRAKEKRNEPGRGRDVSAKVVISWDESVAGTEKKLNIGFSEKCDSCGGTGSRSGKTAGICKQCNGSRRERVVTPSAFGKMTQTRECPACRGTGMDMSEACLKCSGKGHIRTSKNIMVKIPRGIANGQTIRINGMGEPGDRNGARGDLIVNVSVRPKYGF